MDNTSDRKVVSWNSLTFIISVAINFVVYSLFYRTFNPEIFGVYLTSISIFLLGNSLDLGIGISTIKVISEKKIINDFLYINRFVSTFLVIYLGMGLLISSLLFLNYRISFQSIPNISNINGFFLKIVIYFFIIFINGFFKVILEGYYQYIVLGKIAIILATLNLLIAVFIYSFSLSIDYLLYSNIFINLLHTILLLSLIIFKIKIKIDLTTFDKGILKSNIKHNLNVQISYIFGNSIEYIVRYLLGYFISFASVTYYENARKIVNIINGLIATSQRNLINKIAEFSSTNKINEYLNSDFLVFPKLANAYSLFVFGIMNIVFSCIIFYWFKSYDSLLIYSLLSITFTIINFGSPLYSVLLINNNGKHLVIIQMINFFSMLFFLFVFLFLYKNEFGIIGYVIATFVNIWFILKILQSKYDLKIRIILKETYGRQIITLLCILIVQSILLFTFKINFLYVTSGVSLTCLILFFNQTKFLLYKLKKLTI